MDVWPFGVRCTGSEGTKDFRLWVLDEPTACPERAVEAPENTISAITVTPAPNAKRSTLYPNILGVRVS